MNDIRRTILWVIFGFSMVLLWDQLADPQRPAGNVLCATAPKPAAVASAAGGNGSPVAVPARWPVATTTVPQPGTDCLQVSANGRRRTGGWRGNPAGCSA
jgi:YidC/Oxa1 family membrane protein insertase